MFGKYERLKFEYSEKDTLAIWSFNRIDDYASAIANYLIFQAIELDTLELAGIDCTKYELRYRYNISTLIPKSLKVESLQDAFRSGKEIADVNKLMNYCAVMSSLGDFGINIVVTDDKYIYNLPALYRINYNVEKFSREVLAEVALHGKTLADVESQGKKEDIARLCNLIVANVCENVNGGCTPEDVDRVYEVVNKIVSIFALAYMEYNQNMEG